MGRHLGMEVPIREKFGLSEEARAQRDALIEKYHKYVHSIVGRLIHVMALPPSSYDECVSAGYLGLVEAAARFDSGNGADFKAFAFLRIRGAVIDNIRSSSHLSNKAYRYAQALQAVQDLRESCEQSLSKGLEFRANEGNRVCLAEVLDLAAKGVLAFRLSLSDVEREASAAVTEKKDPEMQLQVKQEQEKFRRVVATLPRKERIIIEEYYFQGKSFSQIAQENHGMSKSWVSRLHTRALERLKDMYFSAFAEEAD